MIKERDVLSGFRLLRARKIREFDGTLYEFEHLKTGAKLAWMKTKDENKVFSITFKTLPKDSSGVFHILEHSVLNGSESYPSNSLFVELLKGSLQTYLNATTYPDRTEFPVSSRNPKDFLNLIKVYLDSTLFPLVLKEPRIFEQEGWHYEYDRSSGELLINGVVYNEMKGAFSSPETRLYSNLHALLFDGTSYGFDSGGDPEEIPNLSYEGLKAAHREFYHPTNSYTYLDGDMDIEAVLALIDSYFSRFEREEMKDIVLGKSASYAELLDFYPAFHEEDGAYLCLGQLLKGNHNKSEIMAYGILSNYLTASNDSPLKKAILEHGIAYDADFFLDSNCLQPYLGVTLRQMDAAKKEQALAVIRSTLNHVIEQGIPQEEILAEIDHLEYLVKDLEEPKGMSRMAMAIPAWIYDGDPAIGFSFDKILSDLRDYIENGKYMELLRKITFEGEGSALCMLTPSFTKEEDSVKERRRLDQICQTFSEQEKQDIMDRCQELYAWQNSPDSTEATSAIPRLSISDIVESRILETEVSAYDNTSVLFHPSNTNGIHHYCLYFSTADFSLEEAQLLSFLTNLYAELPTKQYGLTDLMAKMKSRIGVYDFNISAYSLKEDLGLCRPYYRVDFSVLEKQEDEAFALIPEILHNTDFQSDMSRELIFMILMQCKENLYDAIQENGNHYASVRAASHLMASNAFTDATEGIGFYEYLKKLASTYDEESCRLCTKMAELSRKLFTADRMVVSITAPALGDKVIRLANVLGKGEVPKRTILEMNLNRETSEEFFAIPSMVSYAALSALLADRDDYHGSCEVLTNILDFDYLWNEVRVLGGAYGCSSYLSVNGSRGCASYRDPDPMRSIGVFAHQAEFLDTFLMGDVDLEPYIIGAYASIDPLTHVRQQAFQADQDYFLGISAEDRKRHRKELLETSKEDLSRLRYSLILQEGAYATCIIGSADALEEMEYNRID